MKDPVDMLWQDKEIRFDNKFEHLELRRGEFLIDTLSKIEDTKGNNGDNGELQVSETGPELEIRTNFFNLAL